MSPLFYSAVFRSSPFVHNTQLSETILKLLLTNIFNLQLVSFRTVNVCDGLKHFNYSSAGHEEEESLDISGWWMLLVSNVNMRYCRGSKTLRRSGHCTLHSANILMKRNHSLIMIDCKILCLKINNSYLQHLVFSLVLCLQQPKPVQNY